MDFHGGRTQIRTEGTATNATVVAYTVPAGRKFFLIEAMLNTDAGAVGSAYAEIRNALDVHVRNICFVNVQAVTEGVVLGDHFEPGFPVELAEGETVAVVSGVALLVAQLGISGFEVGA